MIKELEDIQARLASCGDTDRRLRSFLDALHKEINALTAYVKRLTLERNAAIADLREAAVMARIPCAYCRYKGASPEEENRVCSAEGFHCWEWHGAREANNE